MANQFFKRKLKEKEASESSKVEEVVVETKTEEVAEMSHESYDVFLDEDGRTYKLVVFKYNPKTNEVKITSQSKIEYGLALTFGNRKQALKQIIKRKYKELK